MLDQLNQWAMQHQLSQEAYRQLLALLDPSMPGIPGDNTSEAGIQSALRTIAPRYAASLWRNNNGGCTDDTGRHIRFGLGNDSQKLSKHWKSSDLIGITPVTSTAIGQTFGVFTAVEVKHPGWKKPSNERDRAQQNFHRTVRGLNGIALFAQSTQDYEALYGTT